MNACVCSCVDRAAVRNVPQAHLSQPTDTHWRCYAKRMNRKENPCRRCPTLMPMALRLVADRALWPSHRRKFVPPAARVDRRCPPAYEDVTAPSLP